MTTAADVDILAALDFEHELPCEWRYDRPCRKPATWSIRGRADGDLFTRALCDQHMQELLDHRDECGNCRFWSMITSVTEIR